MLHRHLSPAVAGGTRADRCAGQASKPVSCTIVELRVGIIILNVHLRLRIKTAMLVPAKLGAVIR